MEAGGLSWEGPVVLGAGPPGRGGVGCFLRVPVMAVTSDFPPLRCSRCAPETQAWPGSWGGAHLQGPGVSGALPGPVSVFPDDQRPRPEACALGEAPVQKGAGPGRP